MTSGIIVRRVQPAGGASCSGVHRSSQSASLHHSKQLHITCYYGRASSLSYSGFLFIITYFCVFR